MKVRIMALGLIIIALALLGAINKAGGQEPLKSRLVEIDSVSEQGATLKCEDSVQAMAACRSFIKGFIQGALLTDTAIIKSIERNRSSFSERAFRNRVGKKEPPTALAGFCLPEGRSILEIAETTLDHVKDAERNSFELARRVYDSLKIDYPC